MHDILILLRIELKRLFKSKLFYVSLFIGLALSVGGFIECAKPHLNITNGFNGGVETYPFSVFNSWMGMFMGLKPISTSYLYIFMLLAALPYCGFFCRDNKNQYILQYYSRMSKNKIHAARFIYLRRTCNYASSFTESMRNYDVYSCIEAIRQRLIYSFRCVYNGKSFL